MAVTLTATARLNSGPFMASLKAMSGAVGGLSSQKVAASKKAIDATDQEIDAHKRKTPALIANGHAAKRADDEMHKSQSRLAKTTASAAQGLSSQRYLFHDLGRQMAMYSIGLAAPFAATVAVAGAWENAFSAVERTADPAFTKSKVKVDALRDSLVDMVQAMPVSFGEVTEIATLANQMGIASSQVADFTRATAMFSATSGVSVDQAATAFGRLTSIMGKKAIPFNEMADSILKVGVNSVATEGEIINVTTQISSIAAQAGFSTKEMIGLSGALASVRVPPELSRGLVTRVFGTIDKAVNTGGASLERLARLSGRTSDQFRNDWRSGGGASAFTDFLTGLKNAGGAARNEIEALGITSVRDVPVLLRLANAADSDGNAGGLLTQTMKDAQDAAGETQRQYNVMADTVWSKMKVLGNNLLAMFDEIGNSNLGDFGKMLDGLSSNIRSFTDSLDEPMEILGGWEMPWTNAEALGFVANLSLMAAGVTALGAVGMKLGASFVGMKQMAAVMTGGKIGPWLTGAAAGASRGAGMAAAEIATTTAAAAASRPVLSAMRSGLVSAGTAWGNFGRGAAAAGKSLANPLAAMRGETFTGIMKSAPAAQGALGSLVRFGLHPATLAIGAATTAAIILSDQYFEAGLDVGLFAEKLAGIDSSSIDNVGTALKTMEVGGASTFWRDLGGMRFDRLFDAPKTIRPFADGLVDAQQSLAKMAEIQDVVGDGIMSDYFTNRVGDMAGLTAAREGIEGVGKSMQALVDGGNKGAAVNTLKSLATSGKELKTAMEISPEIKGLVSSMFASADIEMTDKALHKLATGTLPEVIEAWSGLNSIKTTEIFEGDAEAAGAFEETLNKAAASFISFGDSMSAATTVDENGGFLSFDLGGFSAGLAESVMLQETWKGDMVTIAGETTVGVVEALANLGSEAQPQIAAIAQALRSEDPAMRQAGVDLVRQMEEGVNAGMSTFGGEIGQIMADKAWLRKAVADVDFGNELAAAMKPTDLAAIRAAGEGAGEEVVFGVMSALAKGQITMDQALYALEHDQLRINVDADTTPAQAKVAMLDAIAQVGKIKPVDASTSLADSKVGALDMKASTPKSKPIDLLDSPALGKVASLDAAATASKSKPVDAATGAAMSKIGTLDTAVRAPESKPVDASTEPALGKIYALNGIVTSSTHNHTININEVKTYSSVGAPALNNEGLNPYKRNQADGSVLSFFANGGMSQGGENHTAQFAPAGSWRVFGEAETEGEAYIPLARRKRTRSLAILDQVASRFGMSLTSGAQASQFANGGQYDAQRFSRTSQSVRTSSFGSGGLSASDRQFFAQMLRTVVVQAEGQAITGLTNNINETNARFGR